MVILEVLTVPPTVPFRGDPRGMTSLVRIRVLGSLQVETADPPVTITRFRSRNIAALLAYLALKPGQMHEREFLADLIWPDNDLARNNLRVALHSLRRQLEPPGIPVGAIITTQGRARVGLSHVTTESDASDFEELIRQSRRSEAQSSAERQIALLEKAVQLYQGPLFPGNYEEWVCLQREHLARLFQDSLGRLAGLYEKAGDSERAVDYTRRAAVESASHDSWQSTGIYSSERSLAHEGSVEVGTEAETAPLASRADTTVDKNDLPSTQPPKVPLFLTRFFGRSAEIEELAALLQPRDADGREKIHSRLVTLSGPGGTGKTRLAVHAAQRVAPFFPGGVFWVSLADVPQACQLMDAIVDAVYSATGGRRQAAAGDPLAEVINSLPGVLLCLLVLDNFEHLVAEGIPLVEQLLTAAPNVFCLVTSRQRLLMGTEREVPVLAVPVPTGEGPVPVPAIPPEQLMRFDGVQLFVDRAQMVRPDFQLTARNAAAVASLCDRLDGLPLALELAASWCSTLTPEQMLAHLHQPPPGLLVTRRRDIAPRHRSLDLVLENSYRLLETPLRQLFARLSVFRGTWTAQAAQAVCADFDLMTSQDPSLETGDDMESSEIREGLSRLRERSLLLAEEHDGCMRFRMLLTVRSFADAQLSEAERKAVEARHAGYYLSIAEEAEPHLRGGPQQAHWIAALEADMDNITAILTRPRVGRTWGSEIPLRLGGAMWWFWVVRSQWRQGMHWLRKILQEEKDSLSPARARALYAAAGLSSTLSLFTECEAYCHESLQICGEIGDAWGVAFSKGLLGAFASRQGNYEEGRALMETALSAFRGLSDSWGTAYVLDNLAHAHRDQRAYDQAMPLYAESLFLRKVLDDQQGVAMSLSNLADTAQLQGDWTRAALMHEDSLERFRALGDKAGIGYELRRLGECALQQGDPARAAALNRESTALFWELGDNRRIAECLEKTAVVQEAQGQAERAALLLGAANGLRQAIGIPLPASERDPVERCVVLLKASLGLSVFQRFWLKGELMDLEKIIVDVISV